MALWASDLKSNGTYHQQSCINVIVSFIIVFGTGVSDSSPPQQLTRKPVLTTKEVSDLLLRLFNIQADTLKEYESYDDRTYYVKTEQSFQTSEFILKVLNSENTASEGTVDAQMRVLRHLESYPDLCCQVPLPNLAGDFLSCEMITNEVRNGR